MTAATYNEWEDAQPISPSSPEAFWSEIAWNAAVERMKAMLDAAHSSGIPDWHLTLSEELAHLDTGLRAPERG